MSELTVAEWVKALRSDEYKQGWGLLRSGDEYCCLGVACDVAGVANACEGTLYSYVFSNSGVPGIYRISEATERRLNEAACSNDYLTSKYFPETTEDMGRGFVTDLMSANDDLELSFSEIADVIEAVLPADFIITL